MAKSKASAPVPVEPVIVGRPIVQNHTTIRNQTIDIAAQYEHGDSGFDPEIDDPDYVEPAAIEGDQNTPAPPKRTPPERGPDGKFLPRDPLSPGGDGEPEPDKPHVPNHPAYLKGLAEDLGLSEEEINEATTTELGLTVRRLQRKIAADLADRTVRGTDDKVKGEEDDTFLGRSDQESRLGELGIDESQYDSGLVGAIKAQKQRLDKMEKAMESLVKLEQSRQVKGVHDKYEQRFARMERYKHLIGEGTKESLDPKGPEMAKRVAILNEAQRLAGPKAGEEKVFDHMDKAADNLLSGFAGRDLYDDKDPLVQRQKDWNESTLHRPSYRETEEPKGTRRAVRAVANILRNSKITDLHDEDYGTEEAGLPD